MGEKGEALGSLYLVDQGFQIGERNVRTRFGEIDLIARKNGEIYFVEIKTRTSVSHGHPLESLPPYRVERLRRMAEWYLQRKKEGDRPAHLSLLGIDLSREPVRFDFIADIID